MSFLFPSAAPSAAAAAPDPKSLTAVPIQVALLKGNVGKRSQRRAGARKELNVAQGNDERIPWTRPIKDRSVITVTGLYSQNIGNVGSVTQLFAGLTFTAGALDNFASLANVFDEYRITMIEANIVPSITEVTSAAATVGQFITAVDVDDANAPTTMNQVGSYASSVVSSGTMTHFHRWEPSYAVAAYSGAFTSYTSANGWVDCSSPNVQYFGVKFGADPGLQNNVYACNIRMTVQFRALH